MYHPKSQVTPWAVEATSLVRARAVQDLLAAYGIRNRRHVATILGVLERLGLFHEVISPTPKELIKEIERRAKRMAAELRRRIINICNGKESPANSQEADLAERWEQLGTDRMRLEALKVLSETYQINRGGRITSRYASGKGRTGSPQGPRSQPEITHALQILDRYLEEKYPKRTHPPRRRARARSQRRSLRKKCSMSTNRRRECLGDVLRSAMNLRDSRQLVIDRVRSRLKAADKKTPLDDFDYFDAIGDKNRLKKDWEYQPISLSPHSTVEEK